MESEDIEPLKGNPKRQAIPALRGYVYQIWQSVYAWVTLKPDEVLYLEGAEDLDILRKGGAEAIQVKDLKGKVTLRSKGVVEALNNYWEHQKKNKEAVQFRFLTTANRGLEKGGHFQKEKGLDYWESCMRGADLKPLRHFLVSELDLSTDLAAFISDASDEEIRERLLLRIIWDTGRETRQFLVEEITQELAKYGDRTLDLTLSESEKAVPSLLMHVSEVVCRPEAQERRLNYVDFMGLFEKVQTVQTSKPKLRRLEHVASLVASNLALPGQHGGRAVDVHSLRSRFEDIPSYDDDRLLPRDELVESLLEDLRRYGFLTLRGSAGKGKSVLANLVANKDTSEWRKVSFRGLDPDQVFSIINLVSLAIRSQTRFDFIIDDLNFEEGVSRYENTLTALLRTALSAGSRIILTTQASLPINVVLQLNLPKMSIRDVPDLEEEEIKELVLMHNCPEAGSDAWSKSIRIITQGHPQLVHARVRALEQSDWDRSQIFPFGKVEGIEEVKREYRLRLREQIPSSEARELVYRLSILGGRFQRKHALHLAGVPTRLSNPGEAFDLLRNEQKTTCNLLSRTPPSTCSFKPG